MRGRATYKDSKELEEIIQDWFATNDSWLIIFDNAESEEQIERYLPGHYNVGCNTIITSRISNWSNTIAVNLFSEKDAIYYIEKITKITPDDYAFELCRKLGYLPLAITQTAFYIRNNSSENYRTYLELYNEYSLDLPEEEVNDECKSVRITFDITKYKIGVAARQFLTICSMLPPDDIDADWFTQIKEHLPKELSVAVSDGLLKRRLLRELTSYSLIAIANNKISTHRLLQRVVKEN